MNAAEAVARLEALHDDPEADHMEADEILMTFAPEQVQAAYWKVEKWFA